MDSILPERLLALVRPAFDLVLRRTRSLKRCVQACGCKIMTPRYACKMPSSCVSARRAKKIVEKRKPSQTSHRSQTKTARKPARSQTKPAREPSQPEAKPNQPESGRAGRPVRQQHERRHSASALHAALRQQHFRQPRKQLRLLTVPASASRRSPTTRRAPSPGRASSSSGQSRRSLPPPSFDQLARNIEAA